MNSDLVTPGSVPNGHSYIECSPNPTHWVPNTTLSCHTANLGHLRLLPATAALRPIQVEMALNYLHNKVTCDWKWSNSIQVHVVCSAFQY
jgi:hypothetical protein